MRSYVSRTKQHSTRLRPGTENGKRVVGALTTLGVCGVYWLPWFSIISEAQWRLLINGFKKAEFKPAIVASGVQAKWPLQKERPLLCRETFLDRLTHQEAPRHTKGTEGRPEQHYRGAAVRNTITWAKEYPPGKTIP